MSCNPVHVMQPAFFLKGVNVWYMFVNNVHIALVAFCCMSRLISALKYIVYM